MDPWADEGTGSEAGPSWSVNANTISASSPQFSPAKVREPSSVDPWAEASFSQSSSEAKIESREGDSYEPHRGEGQTTSYEDPNAPLAGQDFDPWGGGAPTSIDLGRKAEHDDDDGEVTSQHQNRSLYEEGSKSWRPESPREHIKSVYDAHPPDDRPDPEEKEETTPQAFDEDDPWGSSKQAKRIQEQKDADAAARQMEILRLQDEASGRIFISNEDDREGEGQAKEVNGTEKEQNGVKIESDNVSSTQSGGWRSFFTRATGKTAESAKEPSDLKTGDEVVLKQDVEGKSSPRTSTSAAPPKLWQAPSLRPTHQRNDSLASQGSAGKGVASPTTLGSANVAAAGKQGPGWEVATKKQTNASSGGFIANFLGHSKEGSGSGSSLTRFGQSLQRPPIVSASDRDPDDSGDIEETGIEWDAESSFETGEKTRKATTGPSTDLLDDDQPAPESAMSRILSRWKGRQTTSDGKGKEGISGDDLSWLENVGGSTDAQQDRKQAHSSEPEADWLAFVGEKESAAEGKTINHISKVQGKMIIPTLAKMSSAQRPPANTSTGSMQPPPRISAPPQHTQIASPTSGTLKTPYDASPDLDDSTSAFSQGLSRSSYRDDPESHDDTLLHYGHQRSSVPAKPAHKQQRSFLSSFSGRPVKPYLFDDDEDEQEHDGSWTAFKDAPHHDATQTTMGGRPKQGRATQNASSTFVSSMTHPAQHQSRHQDQQQQHKTPSRTSTPGSTHSAFLPPPPSSSRSHQFNLSSQVNIAPPPSVPSTTAAKTATAAPAPTALSHGQTLTNDDLSFFENL